MNVGGFCGALLIRVGEFACFWTGLLVIGVCLSVIGIVRWQGGWC